MKIQWMNYVVLKLLNILTTYKSSPFRVVVIHIVDAVVMLCSAPSR